MGERAEEKFERNAEIYRRRMAGEMPTKLGEEYDLSPSRVAKIIIQQKKNYGETE